MNDIWPEQNTKKYNSCDNPWDVVEIGIVDVSLQAKSENKYSIIFHHQPAAVILSAFLIVFST